MVVKLCKCKGIFQSKFQCGAVDKNDAYLCIECTDDVRFDELSAKGITTLTSEEHEEFRQICKNRERRFREVENGR